MDYMKLGGNNNVCGYFKVFFKQSMCSEYRLEDLW